VIGECHHPPFPDGLRCSDGDSCTSNDACAGGICTGEKKDCGALDGVCIVGACNTGTGACEAQAEPRTAAVAMTASGARYRTSAPAGCVPGRVATA